MHTTWVRGKTKTKSPASTSHLSSLAPPKSLLHQVRLMFFPLIMLYLTFCYWVFEQFTSAIRVAFRFPGRWGLFHLFGCSVLVICCCLRCMWEFCRKSRQIGVGEAVCARISRLREWSLCCDEYSVLLGGSEVWDLSEVQLEISQCWIRLLFYLRFWRSCGFLLSYTIPQPPWECSEASFFEYLLHCRLFLSLITWKFNVQPRHFQSYTTASTMRCISAS